MVPKLFIIAMFLFGQIYLADAVSRADNDLKKENAKKRKYAQAVPAPQHGQLIDEQQDQEDRAARRKQPQAVTEPHGKQQQDHDESKAARHRVCNCLADHLFWDQSAYGERICGASGTVGPLIENNDGTEECMKKIAEKSQQCATMNRVLFQGNFDGSELYELLLYGGQLLAQFSICRLNKKFNQGFVDNLVANLLSNPDGYPEMIADVQLTTEPVAWPDVVYEILSVDEVKNIKYGEQHSVYSVYLGKEVRVLVENHTEKSEFGWHGIVYLVEKNGKKLFKFAFVTDNGKTYGFDNQCEIGKFLEFRLMKI